MLWRKPVLTLDSKEENLSQFCYIYLDTHVLSSSSETVHLLKVTPRDRVYLSYNTSIHHPELSAVILCPLRRLCGLEICLNLSGSHFLKRDDTCLSEVCIWLEMSLVSSTSFRMLWLHSIPSPFSPLDYRPVERILSYPRVSLTIIIVLDCFSGSVLILNTDTILTGFIKVIW